MDKDPQNNTNQDLTQNSENQGEKSFVDKVKNSISTWFGKRSTSIRKREASDSEDNETSYKGFQPPSKRTKLPSDEGLSLDDSQIFKTFYKVNDIRKLSPTATATKPSLPLPPSSSSSSSYIEGIEPIAGPSGYQSCQHFGENINSALKDNVEQNNSVFKNSVFKNPKQTVDSYKFEGISGDNKTSISDSEESTSGYSSGRIGSKEVISQTSSKQTSPGASPLRSRCFFENSSERSLFNSSSLNLDRSNTLRSRQPVFEPSVYKIRNIRDKVTARTLNSPFYRGRTIYGGAAAYSKRSSRTAEDYKKSLMKSIDIKPANVNIDKSNAQLGTTARRIMHALQKYSTLVNDAKKIPITTKKARIDSSLVKNISVTPYSTKGARTRLNTELQVPHVTDLLKMKIDQQKTRLQKSTEAVRQIATKSKSVLNEPTYQVAIHNPKENATGKIKTKITTLRSKPQAVETVPALKLNPVALPIKELPKFDFVIAPPSSKFNADDTQLMDHINSSPSTNRCCRSEYEFSAPVVLGKSTKPIQGLNSFKFSEPTIKRRRSIHSSPDIQKNDKNNGDNVSKSYENSSKDRLQVHENILVTKENQSNESSSKVSMDKNESTLSTAVSTFTSTATATSFDDKFKTPTNTWECPTCLIRNNRDKNKCMACETLQPSTVPSTDTFDSKKLVFVPPPKTWECPDCMIRNKDELLKCAACQANKPGSNSDCQAASTTASTPLNVGSSLSFGKDFRKKDDEWECEVCMIRNKSINSKCQCCQSLKPGSVAPITIIPPLKSAVSTSSICNLGLGKTNTIPFTFGIPPAMQKPIANNSSTNNIVFGQQSKSTTTDESDSSTAKFTFGSIKSTGSKGESKKPSSSNDVSKGGFTFGTSLLKQPTTEASTTTAITPLGAIGNEKKATKRLASSTSTAITSSSDSIKITTSDCSTFGSRNENENDTDNKSAVKGFVSHNTVETMHKKEGESDNATYAKKNNTVELAIKSKTFGDVTPASTSMFKGPSTTTNLPPILQFNAGKIDGNDQQQQSRTKEPVAVAASNTITTPSFNVAFNAISKPSLFNAFNATTAPTTAAATTNSGFLKLDSNFKFGSTTSMKPSNEFQISTTQTSPSSSSSTIFGGKTMSKPFTFGSPKTITNHASPFAAGTATGTTSTTAASTSFIDASRNINPVPSFSFKAPSAASAAGDGKSSLFQFGSKTGMAASSATPAFNFNNPPQLPVAQLPTVPSFNFGSASSLNKQQSTPTQIPGFLNSSAPNNNSSGTITNGLFSFNSATMNSQNSNTMGGFNLGSSNALTNSTINTSNSSGSSGGFNFGSGKLPDTSSGGFQFSEMNAMTKPVLNFTGGNSIPTFSAQPTSMTMQRKEPPRKMKKAVRRYAS